MIHRREHWHQKRWLKGQRDLKAQPSAKTKAQRPGWGGILRAVGAGRGEKPGSPSLGEQLAAPTAIGKGPAAPGRSRCAPGGMSGLSEDTRVRDAGAPSPRGGSTQAGWPWWASWATGGCWQRGGLTSGRGTYPQVRETRTRRRECSVTRGFKHGQKFAVAAAAHLCPHPCNCT